MDNAARAPANESSFDMNKNAAINEADPNSTSNMGVVGPGATHHSISTTSTTTTNATGATENAPGYLQQARETLASVVDTVQNAVGIDTPASTLHNIASNAKVEASMPSRETSGAKPGEHTDGVGALPGDNKEEGVARLPTERTSVPSLEPEGAYPREKTGGVGALPGSLNESGVALLPDEREGAHPREKTSGIGALPGSHNESGAAVLPGEHNVRTQEGTQGSTFAAAHPSSEHPEKRDIKTAAAHPIETAKQARRNSASSSSSSEGEQAPGVPKKKISLKDKVSGGMKTAMGKVKRDEEMIQEGNAQRGH